MAEGLGAWGGVTCACMPLGLGRERLDSASNAELGLGWSFVESGVGLDGPWGPFCIRFL